MWQLKRTNNERPADDQTLYARLRGEAAELRPAADDRLQARIMQAVDDCRLSPAPGMSYVRRPAWRAAWIGAAAVAGCALGGLLVAASVGDWFHGAKPATPVAKKSQPAVNQVAAKTQPPSVKQVAPSPDADPLNDLTHDAEMAKDLVLAPLPYASVAFDGP